MYKLICFDFLQSKRFIVFLGRFTALVRMFYFCRFQGCRDPHIGGCCCEGKLYKPHQPPEAQQFKVNFKLQCGSFEIKIFISVLHNFSVK